MAMVKMPTSAVKLELYKHSLVSSLNLRGREGAWHGAQDPNNQIVPLGEFQWTMKLITVLSQENNSGLFKKKYFEIFGLFSGFQLFLWIFLSKILAYYRGNIVRGLFENFFF